MKPVKKTTYLRILIVVIFYQLTVIPVNWHYALKQLLDTVNYITTSFALYLIKGIRLIIWRFLFDFILFKNRFT